MSNIKCSDCKRPASEVSIPAVSVYAGYGHCLACLAAPSCDACGAHTIADQADIKGEAVKLCKECRTLMGSVIQAPAPAPSTTKPVIQTIKAARAGRKVRRPARMAV
jgi:hypothetical protein